MSKNLRQLVIIHSVIASKRAVINHGECIIHIATEEDIEFADFLRIKTLCLPRTGVQSRRLKIASKLHGFTRVCTRCLRTRNKSLLSGDEKPTTPNTPLDLNPASRLQQSELYTAFTVASRIGFPNRFTKLVAISKF